MRHRTADRLAIACIVVAAVLSVLVLAERLRNNVSPAWGPDARDIARVLLFFGLGIVVGRRARAS